MNKVHSRKRQQEKITKHYNYTECALHETETKMLYRTRVYPPPCCTPQEVTGAATGSGHNSGSHEAGCTCSEHSVAHDHSGYRKQSQGPTLQKRTWGKVLFKALSCKHRTDL